MRKIFSAISTAYKILKHPSLFWSLGFLVVVSLLGSIFPGGCGFVAIAFLFILPGSLIYVGAWLYETLSELKSRRWPSALKSFVAYPASLGILFCAIGPVSKAGDYLHFLVFSPYYLAKVYAFSSDTTGPIRFYWGETGGLGTIPVVRSLVYDRSSAYVTYAQKTAKGESHLIGNLGYDTYELFGSFYVEESFYSGSG